MSTSQKQIDANRKNARKSSGPRTTEGKKFASKNAVKHGLYSDDIIIKSVTFSEDPEEYDQLVRSLYDELSPKGRLQEHLVVKIANCMWRSQRVVRAETAHINTRMDDISRDVRDAAHNKKWCSGLDRDKDDTSLTPEETERVIENGIGQRIIPDDETAHYILRFEMRLDRQLTRALKTLRMLQMTPKVKRTRNVDSERMGLNPRGSDKTEGRAGSLGTLPCGEDRQGRPPQAEACPTGVEIAKTGLSGGTNPNI